MSVDQQIDDLHPRWHLPASPKTQFDLLPDHPWIWRNDLASTGEVVAGAMWRTSIDLVAEPIDDEGSVVAVIAPRSIVRLRGRPIGASDVPRSWRARRLILIPSGTELPSVGVVHWGDDAPGHIAGQSIELAMPDGRSALVVVSVQQHPSGGGAEAMTWRELTCAAGVVPVHHPLASNSAACLTLIERIEKRAEAAWRTHMRSAAC